MLQAIYNKRFLSRGPKIVAIGGGTGLSTLLRGLKDYTSNLTAIVTVADDGGRTGRLRQEFGVVAPGDIRQCIAALAEAEPLMSRLFQYRFTEGTGLEGHSFGNLFIVAMSEVTGNFETAIHEASRVLNVRGTILPSTLEDVTLSARTNEDELVHGEHNISERGTAIRDLYLNPPDAEAHPDAVRAILDADLVVIGPGSLYTSVLPNLLVEGIQKALACDERAADLRLQRRDAARRDRRLHRGGPPRSPSNGIPAGTDQWRGGEQQHRSGAAGGVALEGGAADQRRHGGVSKACGPGAGRRGR